MNKEYCEKIRISAMAISDGERPELSEVEITEHIASCVDCRIATDQMKDVTLLLDGKQRKIHEVNVLNEIEPVLASTKTEPAHARYKYHFIFLGIILLAFKIIEVLPDVTTGIIVKFLSILVIVLFFSLTKENPFTISQNLKFKGDLQ